MSKEAQGFADQMPPKSKATKERIDQNIKDGQKFEVDLDAYLHFVDLCTSKESKEYDALTARYEELKSQGCNIQRLDTAASGLVAEGGEHEVVSRSRVKLLPSASQSFNSMLMGDGDEKAEPGGGDDPSACSSPPSTARAAGGPGCMRA